MTPVRVGRALRIVIAWGDDARSTGAAVGGLRERWEADRATYERHFDDVARVVEDGVLAVERGDVDTLGKAFERNQALLATLGVSSPAIETRVAAAKAAGALGAKLTGGGAGGAIIAVAHDADALATAMRATGTVLVVDVASTEAVARSA